MARRGRLFAVDLLYHVIVHDNQRQKNFLSEADYQAYLTKLLFRGVCCFQTLNHIQLKTREIGVKPLLLTLLPIQHI